MKKKDGLVYGIGINDADYKVHGVLNGKRVRCPYYSRWLQMLRRCYDEKSSFRAMYIGVTVCAEWLRFSVFKAWMEKQPWQGNELDKDLLFKGNKVYSPETCCLIPDRLNCLFLGLSRHDFNKIGAQPRVLASGETVWASTVKDMNTKSKWLGTYKTQEEAHLAWRKAKYGVILDVVDWWKSDEVDKLCYREDLEKSILKLAESIRDGNYDL